MGRKWTEKEKKYVEENFGRVPVEDMAVKLNRTEAAVKEKARILQGGTKKKNIHRYIAQRVKSKKEVQDMYLQSATRKRMRLCGFDWKIKRMSGGSVR